MRFISRRWDLIDMKLSCLLLAVSAFGQVPSGSIDSGDVSDVFFAGGSVTTFANPGDTTARFGNFAYHIPVVNVPYLVTFRWIENTATGPGQRTFRVTLNDQVVFDQLDLFKSCGRMVPCSRTLLVIPTAGMIDLVFTTQIRNAIISSIDYGPLSDSLGISGAWIALPQVATTVPNLYLLHVAQANGSKKHYLAMPALPEHLNPALWN